jgi:uncharacterized protein YjbI with pentapeptide repeats
MGTSSGVSTLEQKLATTLVQLRQDSRWINLKVVGVISATLGLVSDSLQSLFPLLPWFFPATIVATVLGFIAWLGMRKAAHKPEHSRTCSLFARTTLCGFIASAVLTPIFLLNMLLPGDRGVLVQLGSSISEAQDYLAKRLDRIDHTLGDLKHEAKQSNEQLAVLTDEAKTSNKHLAPIEQAMSLSAALALLERAKANRSGTNQGQTEAVNALTAQNHSLAGEDLSGISFANGLFNDTDFSNTSLHFSNLSDAVFNAVKFDSAGMRFATADNTKFQNGTSLIEMNASFMSARTASFVGAEMHRANFFGADLHSADFSQAKLNGAVFAFADLRNADFQGATLINADFTGALIETANFTSAVFGNTSVFGAARGPDALSAEQLEHVCRPNLQNDSIQVLVELQERWPSTKFSSGYDYDPNLFVYRNYLKSRQDTRLPPCLASSSKEQSAPGYHPGYPGNSAMNVDTYYLDKARRRQELRKIMNAFEERMHTITGN